ncbi:MAG: hypothetical protein V2J25_11710 [Desulfatiglans sp.]|jgi:cupin 2 domain-containing protein|nr:phosphoribosylaminoimidazole carboxylase [Thermodesulfobacteriota bacterium]MEE4353524.1 hypothetical protein [Desulfatiglans sp.]
MSEIKNIFADIPRDLLDEYFDEILKAGTLRIERIVSRGHASPKGHWDDQDHHEWVILLRGHARLRFQKDNEIVELMPGNHVNIPAHVKHRVEWTDPESDTLWLAVHY